MSLISSAKTNMRQYSLGELGITVQSMVIHGIMTLPLLNIEIFCATYAQAGSLGNGVYKVQHLEWGTNQIQC